MPGLRGAKPTPRHKLLWAKPHRVVSAAPAEFAVVPKQLSMWGNQTYGDCVTAEEAYAKAAWSIMCGLPETFISEADAIAWAKKHGFLDGATLTDVMDVMQTTGLPADGQIYTDGHYQGVDYSNESILQSAISQGPVKIGIDADALPSGAGNGSGWFAIAKGNFGNEDHCVCLSGYGSAEYLYQAVFAAGHITSATPPAELAGKKGYLLFTWDGVGFVTYDWLMGTCQEAWLRLPTTNGQGPTPVPPAPPSPPVPVPPSPPGPPPTPAIVSHGTAQTQPYTLHVGGIFGGSYTIPGQTIPVTVTSAPAAKAGAVNWSGLVSDLFKLVMDVKGNADLATFEADVKAIAADLGVSL